MSGASIAKKVAKAYGKAGKKLGYPFAVYRSDDYLQPVQDRNIQFEVTAAYSFDMQFAQTQSADFQPMKLFVDATLLQEGDILVSEEAGVTLTLVSKFDIRSPVAIESNDRISISRTVYDNTDGFGPKGQVVYTDVPAKVLQVASAFSSNLQQNGSALGGATPVYSIWTWLPSDKALEPADTIVFANGKKAIIHSIELNPLGYRLSVQEV